MTLLPQGRQCRKIDHAGPSPKSQKLEDMSQDENESRITELEIQLAHMETVMSDLSDMIKSQWDRIDLLERRNKLMSDDIKRMVDFLRTSPEDDAPPPHY